MNTISAQTSHFPELCFLIKHYCPALGRNWIFRTGFGRPQSQMPHHWLPEPIPHLALTFKPCLGTKQEDASGWGPSRVPHFGKLLKDLPWLGRKTDLLFQWPSLLGWGHKTKVLEGVQVFPLVSHKWRHQGTFVHRLGMEWFWLCPTNFLLPPLNQLL